MYRFKDEIGNRYGKLVVIEFSHTDKQNSYWKCLCDCGEMKVTRGSTLRSGQCKSCGKCDIQSRPSDVTPHKRQWLALKNGAKTRNLSVEIDFNQYVDITKQNCYYCGSAPYDKHYAYSRRRKTKGIHEDSYSIFNGVDRIDSSLGYTKENICSCCNMCNRMKSDFNILQFLKKIEQIYEYQHRKKIGFS